LGKCEGGDLGWGAVLRKLAEDVAQAHEDEDRALGRRGRGNWGRGFLGGFGIGCGGIGRGVGGGLG